MTNPNVTEALQQHLGDLKYRMNDARAEIAVALSQTTEKDEIVLAHLNTAKGLLTERP